MILKTQENERISKIVDSYFKAKRFVLENGYKYEIEWQENISFNSINEENFLVEVAWVILSTGMREQVIRSIFPNFVDAMFGFKSAKLICKFSESCRERALNVFNNPRKVDSILFITKFIQENGFEFVKRKIKESGIDFLLEFPYIGPITVFHLAKNLGLSLH